MKNNLTRSLWLAILASFVTLLSGPAVCKADSIVSVAPAAGSPGTSLDALELLDLGIDPGSFLFTGNMLYDLAGQNQLDIIGADIDPSTTTSLDGVTTTNVILTFSDSGSVTSNTLSGSESSGVQPSTPEPATWMLLATALFATLAYKAVAEGPASMSKLVFARASRNSSKSLTDSSSARRFSPDTESSTSRV